jgi:hypothetical protein
MTELQRLLNGIDAIAAQMTESNQQQAAINARLATALEQISESLSTLTRLALVGGNAHQVESAAKISSKISSKRKQIAAPVKQEGNADEP